MLFERGHNVVIPRLPHHGYADRMTTALARLTVEELKTCGTGALASARDLGDEVIVVGFSAGGTLAAWLAQEHGCDHAVVVAPFLGSRWIPRAVTPAVARAAGLAPNLFVWWDPLRRERLSPEHGYPRYATHAVVRVYDLGAGVMSRASATPPASSRITIVVNLSDTTCDNRAVGNLERAWRSRSPGAIETVRLAGLPACHDIIEPERRVDPAARIYPRLLEIVDAR